MKKYLIPELFFKKIAEKGNLYSRVWFYWLGNFTDEIFSPDFVEKHINKKEIKGFSKNELKEIYFYGIEYLNGFKIIKKEKKENSKELNEIAEKIIDYLNEKSKKNFRKNKTNFTQIFTRLKEGYSFEDFKKVIDLKCYDWMGTNMDGYIRPQTLFSNKFESYLNSKKNESNPTSFDKFALAIARAQSIDFRGPK